jgi:glycine betaine/choline ABC-type transport system substrate-binding protein
VIAGNSTDGRIAALDLVQLKDDRHYFPPYEAVFVVRPNYTDKRPGDSPIDTGPLLWTVHQLARAISTDEMRKLNYEVDGVKRDKKIVVHEWLVKKGFVQ